VGTLDCRRTKSAIDKSISAIDFLDLANTVLLGETNPLNE